MISFNETGETLRVTVSGVFDFDTSREMLLKCKTHGQQHKINKIDVKLDQITSCNSCAIGALILLADKAPNGFSIHLDKCSEEVHQLFDSGFLDRYFSIQHTARPELPCTTCYEQNCASPAAGCDKATFLGSNVYPLFQAAS